MRPLQSYSSKPSSLPSVPPTPNHATTTNKYPARVPYHNPRARWVKSRVDAVDTNVYTRADWSVKMREWLRSVVSSRRPVAHTPQPTVQGPP
eukprot:29926-Eustigmatos_ZCMA.PRE.1